jgi:hypothetical protein
MNIMSKILVTTDGFGLINGFIGLFDTVCCYTLQYTVTHTHSHTLVSLIKSSLSLLGSGFQL